MILFIILFIFFSLLPIIQKGLRKNLSRPTAVWYLERHPDDHNLLKKNHIFKSNLKKNF